MIHGRVIGNELRDVPPECLPVWGQRWSGYRAPHGPSPFSTRVFNVDGMSEVGPVLTSPTQFEMILTDEDEGEDTSSESIRFHNSFYSSPAMCMDVIEPAFRPETPTPQSAHFMSSHPYDIPLTMQRNMGHRLPSSAYFTPSLQGQESNIQYYVSEPFPRLPPRYRTPIHFDHESLGNNSYLQDMTADTQPRASSSHTSLTPSVQLQYSIPPQSDPQWQSANAYTQPYPFQPNPLSSSDDDYSLQPSSGGNQAGFISAMSPSSFHSFRMPPNQRNPGVQPFLDDDPTRILGILHTRNPRDPTMAPRPSVSIPPSTESLPWSPDVSESLSLSPIRTSRHSISDHGSSSRPQSSLITYSIEDSILMPLGNPGGCQFRR